MNKLEIDNLRQLVGMKYAHICLASWDLQQFTNIPDINKVFYPFRGRGEFWEKRGFFNGGATTVWFSHSVEHGHIKIIDRAPPESDILWTSGNAHRLWSKPFSFKESNSVHFIKRMMNLKAFWWTTCLRMNINVKNANMNGKTSCPWVRLTQTAQSVKLLRLRS